MAPMLTKYGSVVFSIAGALIIVGASWWTKGSESDTWLYLVSVWMILFSALEAYASVKADTLSRLVLGALVGAFLIILAAWWANGAEQAELFFGGTAAMLAMFLGAVSVQRRRGR